MPTKNEALNLLAIAIQAATDSGLFDNEMLCAVANADSINDFCDAVSFLSGEKDKLQQ
ncbi:TPA: hypothetical protein ACNV0U_005780 [Klebsiella variicola]|nr:MULTISPECIES: hypothetical protein [Klebsiella]QOV61361.1 hypothetical protein AMN10_27315 [Klebsiella variicola]CEP33427.1 hypothetical protein KV8917_900018 [Klebsiella variicola]HBV1819840.1 hypothetical protein [Klebsiella pneumoniae]HBV1825425.1 hypothetical protein [Klebsiella pneumoniae]